MIHIPILMNKKCGYCGKPLKGKASQLYCNVTCRVAAWRIHKKDKINMFKNKMGLTGYVKWVVRDENGEIKRFAPNFFQRLFNLPGNQMRGINHNIVTSEGDALVADLMQETPERTKVDETNGLIGVGTGFASETKAIDALVTATGSDEDMDVGYPQTKGDWAATDDGIVVYMATFEAGDLNDTGIDEALLHNGTDTLAYAEINPAVDVSASDTLEVTWEITVLGA